MRGYKIMFVCGSLLATIVILGCSGEPESQLKSQSTPSNKHLYMDIHKNVPGLTAEAVIGAHQKDLEVQGKYGVNYLKYWYDENTGIVFCLVEAPSMEAAARVHKEAHGLVADEIIEVTEGE